MLHRRNLISGCLVLASMAASATLLAADKPPIKIGGSLPLSGFQAPNGTMYRIGITMAIEDLNAAGGVNGSKIDFLLDDDQGRPDQAVLLFRRHVSDGVVASLGPISGTTWESVAPLANSMKAPVLNFTALKPGISKKPYALRVLGNARSSSMARFCSQEHCRIFSNRFRERSFDWSGRVMTSV